MEEPIKYFLFSKEQMDFVMSSEASIGKEYFPGTVIVSGVQRLFTEICEEPKNRYSDAKLVIQGKLSELNYSLPYSE